jgi:hypothetical protein
MNEEIPIDGEASPHRAYRIEAWGNEEVTASFDSLEEAIDHIRTLRMDTKWAIRFKRQIVWPENFEALPGWGGRK